MSRRTEARAALLEAALPHVAFDGWSLAALRAGATDAGLPDGSLARLFPGGAREAAEFFSTWADARMAERLAASDLAGLRTDERIAAAVRARIEALAPHREAVRRCLSYLALPGNAPTAARCLARTVDEMWHCAGDRSADFSWYTKRATLAGIYTATMLFWLEDASEGFAETWAFLGRRLQDVARVGRLRGRLEEAVGRIPDPSAFLRRFSVER